jgi:hypothetical protein
MRGILLGLSGPQLVMASLAAGTLILGLYLGAVVMTFPIILVFVVLGFVSTGGRKIVEWGPIGARWLWRSAGGQLLYRRRVVKPRPAGTLAFPGDAARLSLGLAGRPCGLSGLGRLRRRPRRRRDSRSWCRALGWCGGRWVLTGSRVVVVSECCLQSQYERYGYGST